MEDYTSRLSAIAEVLLFLTLVAGPRRSLSLKLSDIRVYEPHIRARLGTAAHFAEMRHMFAGVTLHSHVH